MSTPKKTQLEDHDYFAWEYEEQTKMKHLVFADYFDKWVKILGSCYSLNYFDCFGGCGAYIDRDEEKIYYGSPVLAADIINKNDQNLGRDVNLVILEKDEENKKNIKKILKEKAINTTLLIFQGDFDEQINHILDLKGNKLKPTFFFIDPFGFKIKISTIKRIMGIGKSEIILNFMFNYINRFLKNKDLKGVLTELYGNDKWQSCISLSGIEREECIVKSFRMNLKGFVKYVCPYKISFPQKKQTFYYLFHLTNKIKGCSIMKSCFAKYNFGKIQYCGKNTDVDLFESDVARLNNIEQQLKTEYSKQTLSFDEIISGLIDNTPYLESDIRKVLKNLEKKQAITVKRITSKKRGLSGKDLLIFK